MNGLEDELERRRARWAQAWTEAFRKVGEAAELSQDDWADLNEQAWAQEQEEAT